MYYDNHPTVMFLMTDFGKYGIGLIDKLVWM